MKALLIVAIILSLPMLQVAGAMVPESEVTEIAVPVENDENEDADESDSELREGTVVIEGEDDLGAMPGGDCPYEFINISANRLIMNGDDWQELCEAYGSRSTSGFTFVHIGDSHIQADIATNVMRGLFQNEGGNSGRGLVIPFKLAGTNQPLDYLISLSCKSTSAKMLKRPWLLPVAFTGIGVMPASENFELYVENRKYFDNTFRFIRIYATGDFEVTGVSDPLGNKVIFHTDKQRADGYTDYFFDRPMSAATLSIEAAEGLTLHGLMLSAEAPGVMYHTIGNNGATFFSYNQLPDLGRSVSTLYPDLIIVSLGTNEAFGKITDEEFYRQIQLLVNELRVNNPESKLLLTTPKECQRRVGSRKRRRARASYQTVDNCLRLRNVIMAYGRDNGVPVYDWWEIAGGEGAAAKWVANALLSSDRVHNTAEGYRLFGNLFHSALHKALSAE